jgi:hypothetical protein
MKVLFVQFSPVSRYFLSVRTKDFALKHPGTMKMAVFWDVAPCSQVEKLTDVSEMLTASIIRLPDYMTQHPRRVIFMLAAVRTRNLTQEQSSCLRTRDQVSLQRNK